ncbi:MAG: hypothetical protein AABX02_03285 [archaeon]
MLYATSRIMRDYAKKYRARFETFQRGKPDPADNPELRESARMTPTKRLQYLMRETMRYATTSEKMSAEADEIFETPPNSVRMIWGKNAPAMWDLIREGMLSPEK